MEVDDRPNRPKKPMLTYWVIAIIVFLLLNTFVFPNLFRRQVEQTDYSTFLQMIEEKNIGEVSVEDTQITFSDKSGEHIYKTGTMNDPDLVNRLEEAGAVFSKPIVQQMGMLEYMLKNDEQDGRWREHDDLWHGRRLQEQCQSLCKIR